MSTQNHEKLKELVRNKYSDIAIQSDAGQEVSCCGTTGCCDSSKETGSETGAGFTIMAESYDRLQGYHPGADLQLGCGIPVEHAGLAPGQSVLDLGSGAGNDLFVARSITGATGRLTGLDFSDAMTHKARENVRKLGYENMEFITGDIENMPFDDSKFDVLLSNCVLNLVPDKIRAYSEIFRVLKSGGHFSISDIVLEGDIPDPIRKAAEAYVGCVSGATQKDTYLDIVENTGFTDISIRKEREISIPSDWIRRVLADSDDTGRDIISGKISDPSSYPDTFRVLSITLNGTKP